MSDGTEELLELHPRRPGRRTWAALAVTAVIAAGGFVLTRSGGVGPPAAAPPKPRMTSATPSPVTSAVPVPRPVCLDVGDSALNCGVSATLPRAVLRAARTLLPGAAVISSTTVTGRDGHVVSRRVIARDAAGSTLSVRISAANGQQGGYSVIGLGDGLSVQYGTDLGRRHVAVSVQTVRGASAPAVAALRTLARDPRLFALA